MIRRTLVHVAALATVGTLGAVFASMPATAAAGDVNLLATYGSVKNSDGLIGLVGVPFYDGEWTYSGSDFPVDTAVSADSVDCTVTWTSFQLLCDPAPTSNVRGQLTQDSGDVGFTSAMGDQDSAAYIVIDLGAVSTFDSYEVYQMVGSDGNVTSASLDVSSVTGDAWPTAEDGSWTTVVAQSDVNDETSLDGAGPFTNTDVTTFDFSATSGRYIKLTFWNDGAYENDSYIEVAGAKLFGHPGESLAETGVDGTVVGIVGTIAITSIVLGAVVRRRSRA